MGLQAEQSAAQVAEGFERQAQDNPEKFWGEFSEGKKEDLHLPKVETDGSADLDHRHLDLPTDSSMGSLR